MRTSTARCRIHAVVLALSLFAPISWAGPDIIEGDDAASLPANAKETIGIGTLNSISGKLDGLLFTGPGDFEDMYLIRIAVPTLFSATTAGGSTNFDTQLWLFRADETGLLANDNENAVSSASAMGSLADDGSGAMVLTPGLYYLAVSGAGNVPSSITGNIFLLASQTEVSGPDGPGASMPVSSWTLGGGLTGDYTISLTGCEFAFPPDYLETVDAGDLPGTADVPAPTGGGGGPLTSIGGDLVALFKGGADLADMYLLDIVDPPNFKASTTGGLVNFNTQLWLFDADGFGVLGNDDDPEFGVTSILLDAADDGSGSQVTTPGLYYLAISGFDHDPTSGGQPIFDQQTSTEISGPDGAGGATSISGWTFGGGQGTYTIFLEGVEYPPTSPTCPLGTIAECADTDSDGIRDDGCVWWSCSAGACLDTEVIFGDMGGQFGACPPDGSADNNDRNHALNCFADVTPGGVPGYMCEDAPPVAYNVDAGGPFGDCGPDGVCDGNDAFLALNAFSGLTSCTCPLDGGPAPAPAKVRGAVDHARIRLETTANHVAPGGLVEVHAYLVAPLDDLRGYQLHMAARGGIAGALSLVDVSLAEGVTPRDRRRATSLPRPVPFVFAGLASWSAFNVETAQVLVGLDTPGVTVDAGYLATFTWRATPDAAGSFVIELLHDEDTVEDRTFLFSTRQDDRIHVLDVAPVVVEVRRPTRPAGR